MFWMKNVSSMYTLFFGGGLASSSNTEYLFLFRNENKSEMNTETKTTVKLV